MSHLIVQVYLYEFSGAITQNHRLGGLYNGKLQSPSSEGKTSKIKGLAGLIPSETCEKEPVLRFVGLPQCPGA